MIDYQAVLNIINTSDNPAYALEIFVAQEKEAAAHEATQAIKRKDHEASQRRGYPWGLTCLPRKTAARTAGVTSETTASRCPTPVASATTACVSGS